MFRAARPKGAGGLPCKAYQLPDHQGRSTMAANWRRLLWMTALLAIVSSTDAVAMSGACYLDRAPGGCFETASKLERSKNQEKEQYQRFLSSMAGTPTQRTDTTSNVPAFCAVAPDPKNGRATMAPIENLSQDQIVTCTAAADEWWSRRREGRERETQNYLDSAQWRKVTATNGMTYQIDLAHIRRLTNGNVTINVVPVVNGAFNVMEIEQFIFDCQGQYQVVNGAVSPSQYAPPQSVAGLISAIACARAKTN